MVQYKRKPIIAPRTHQYTNDTEVWVIDVTGEVFDTYEEYLQRFEYYSQKKFTCEITGHTNLTFFEALKSERHGSAAVDSTFPEQLREPILRKVQFSTISRIDDLVNDLYETLKDDFFVGERVQVLLDDTSEPTERLDGTITEKATLPEAQDPLNGPAPAMTRYFVKVDNNPGSEAFLDNQHIFRERKLFNRSIIRSFLKHTISHERYDGAPWLVKEDVARRYKISTTIPAALQHDHIVAERKAYLALKKGRPDEHCLGFFREAIPGLAQATKTYKGKLPPDLVMHFQDALAGRISPSVPPPGLSPNSGLSHKDTRKEVQIATVPPRPLPVKYPIEDLEIFPRRNYSSRPDLKFFPHESKDVDCMNSSGDIAQIGKESVQSILEIWNTLNVHSDFFVLDSFTFDDFVDAMLFRLHDVECELFAEIHCAVLKLLVDEKGNIDAMIPTPPTAEEESEDETSVDNSAASTPAPEPSPPRSRRGKRASMLRNDITDELKKNDEVMTDGPQNCAEEMLGERDWMKRLAECDFSSGGWQTIVVGLLHHLTLCKPSVALLDILAHLAPINHVPGQETARRQYISLDVNLRVAALEALVMLAITTRSFKDSMDDRNLQMTDFRKDKLHWQKEKKSLLEEIHSLDEQRRALYPDTEGTPTEEVLNGNTITVKAATAEIVDDTSEHDTSDSEDDKPHKGGRRRISSRANDLKRKREQEEETRKEREKKAKIENSVSAQYKSFTRDIQKKEKEVKNCEEQALVADEKLRVSSCHRTKVLGRDRFWNRYYWFEKNGMPFAGQTSSSTAHKGYANGRIWVQGPDQLEREGYIDLPAGEAQQYHMHFGMSMQERQVMEHGATQLVSATDFGYYDTPEELDALIGWLDDRGHREKALRKDLNLWRDKVVEQMTALQQYESDLAEKKASAEEPVVGIATRKKTYVDHNATKYPCLAWTNSLAKAELGHLHSEGTPKKVAKAPRGKAVPVVTEKTTTRSSRRG